MRSKDGSAGRSRYNAAMEVIPLQSGSSGNCIYVEADDVRLLFDAGISGCQAEQRLAAHGRDIRDVDALIISHDHRDHTRCMGIYQRKYGVPIHVTADTFETALRHGRLGAIDDVRFFLSGSTLHFGAVRVETVPTPHDAADGVAFVVDDSRHRLGILTDLGHVFDELEEVVASLDAVIIESNYDVSMLDRGPYPEFLKRRIRGPHGHLSNSEAANLLGQTAQPSLKWACLAHLSEENNDPRIVLDTHREVIGSDLPLLVADRRAATDVLVV